MLEVLSDRIKVFQVSRSEVAELIQEGLDAVDQVCEGLVKEHGDTLLGLASTKAYLAVGSYALKEDGRTYHCPLSAAGLYASDVPWGCEFATGFDQACDRKWPEDARNYCYFILELID